MTRTNINKSNKINSCSFYDIRNPQLSKTNCWTFSSCFQISIRTRSRGAINPTYFTRACNAKNVRENDFSPVPNYIHSAIGEICGEREEFPGSVSSRWLDTHFAILFASLPPSPTPWHHHLLPSSLCRPPRFCEQLLQCI